MLHNLTKFSLYFLLFIDDLIQIYIDGETVDVDIKVIKLSLLIDYGG